MAAKVAAAESQDKPLTTKHSRLKDLLKFIFSLIFTAIICFAFYTLLLSVGLTPNPTFNLHEVKLSTFNVSTTHTLTSNFQITFSCRNDESFLRGFNFEKTDVYASYMNQQITLPTALPPTYLEDVAIWSLSVNGTDVPLTPSTAASLVQDVTAGNVLINVQISGRLRSKREYLSSRCRLDVNCPAYIMFGNDTDVIGSSVKRPFVEDCHVGVIE